MNRGRNESATRMTAYDMWLKRVNAAGGINVGGTKMKVKLVAYDYQTNGKRAQQIAEKLITSDKVDFLAAPFGSGHTKIVAAVAERYGVPLMASVSSSLSVYNQGFKNLFGTLAPNTGLTDAMFKVSKSTFKGSCSRTSLSKRLAAVAISPSAKATFPSAPRKPRFVSGSATTALKPLRAWRSPSNAASISSGAALSQRRNAMSTLRLRAILLSVS